MVHATVKRESPDSFTVTFDDASSPEAASETTTKTMSATSPAPSKNTSTANVNTRKEQAIAMAKDAVLYARDAVLAVENTDKFMISRDSENKENLLQSKNLAYKAASKGITAIVMLRKLGLVPEGDEQGGMQEYVTKMVQQSKIIRDSNEPRVFENAIKEFSKAVNGFEQSITIVNDRTSILKNANSSDSTKKAADAVRMAYAAIEKAKAAIIGYDPTTLYSNNAVGTRISEPVIALQDAAEAATEAAAMNDTNTEMTTHSQGMTDSANLFWITIRMGSDKLSRTIDDFERSTADFSKAAGINLPNASGATSASASKSIVMSKPGATSGTTAVSAVSDKATLASKLKALNEEYSKAEARIKQVTKSGQNIASARASISQVRKDWTSALDAATNAGVNVTTLDLKMPLTKSKSTSTSKPKPKKGGRRTRRKRTHHKRTHRKRK